MADFLGELGGSSFDAVASVSGFLALSDEPEADSRGVFLPFLVRFFPCFFLLLVALLLETVSVVTRAALETGIGDSDSSLDEIKSGETGCLLFSFDFLEAAVDFFGFLAAAALVTVSVDESPLFPFLFLLPAAVVTTGKAAVEVVGGWREEVGEILGDALAVTGA